jgi:hypothetical protein
LRRRRVMTRVQDSTKDHSSDENGQGASDASHAGISARGIVICKVGG